MTDPVHDPRRHVLQRWQEYDGEYRTAVLRLLGIAAFYAVELANYHGFSLGPLELDRREDITREFHVAVTALAVAWTMAGIGVLLCLRNRIFPEWLKLASTAVDLAILTAVLLLADGPSSPLVAAYFVIVAFSSLRFSLALVRFSAIGAMGCYLFLNGFARWFTERDIGVPRYHQLIVLIALGLTGIVLGQVVRGTLRLISSTDSTDREADGK